MSEKCPPHLNSVLMLPCENDLMKHHISYFYNALLEHDDDDDETAYFTVC